ncbi:hypothetical protein [Streptomyces sp. NPDC056544]|uniref:hypothetical protein n=1 Tax=unclassified Streptomyces TaxID=2593676 RepID=UPI003699159A
MTAVLGLGTYRVRTVEEPARTACSDGRVWLDTAPNYATAHQTLGPVIADHPRAMVTTKTGFFTGQEGVTAVAAGVLTPEEAAVGHSLHPGFTRWQTDRSLAALSRADIVFVHNPEHTHQDRAVLHARLRAAF